MHVHTAGGKAPLKATVSTEIEPDMQDENRLSISPGLLPKCDRIEHFFLFSLSWIEFHAEMEFIPYLTNSQLFPTPEVGWPQIYIPVLLWSTLSRVFKTAIRQTPPMCRLWLIAGRKNFPPHNMYSLLPLGISRSHKSDDRHSKMRIKFSCPTIGTVFYFGL